MTQISSGASTSVSSGIPPVILLALVRPHIEILDKLLLQPFPYRAPRIHPFEKGAAKLTLAVLEDSDVGEAQLHLVRMLLPTFLKVLTSKTVTDIISRHNPDEYRISSITVPHEHSSIYSEQSIEGTFNAFNRGLSYPESGVSNKQADGMNRLASF